MMEAYLFTHEDTKRIIIAMSEGRDFSQNSDLTRAMYQRLSFLIAFDITLEDLVSYQKTSKGIVWFTDFLGQEGGKSAKR